MQSDEDPSTQASEAKVRSALNTLTRTDLRKLYLFARKLLSPKQVFAEGREKEDPVHDAILRTFELKRKWKPSKTGMLGHLYGTVRSIVSHLPERYHGAASEVPVGESADSQGEHDQPVAERLVERQKASDLPPDDAAYYNQVLSRIKAALENDPKLLEIMRLIADRAGDPKPGPAIQQQLGITEKEYRARVIRMRRALYHAFPEGIDYGRKQ